jgi:L-ascorbate metabolism protein UlaG (beta-lactamase superfamily)
MQLIPAIKKDEALVAEMDAKLADKDHVYLWWLGQSGYLLQWAGERILIDPYLSDSLTAKYAGTKKPHERLSERVMEPELLRNISIVTSSHNHTDHLDEATLQPIIRNNPGIKFIIPEANRDFVANRVSCAKSFPLGLNDGEWLKAEEFMFYGIPAKHNEIERDNEGRCKYMGWVIKMGNWAIYHSGDTLWFPSMPLLLKPFQVDVAILPINGNDPAREVAGNLNSEEAVELGKQIGARFVIPCHYDMFGFNTADPADFVKLAESHGQPFRVLRGGEYFKIPDH